MYYRQWALSSCFHNVLTVLSTNESLIITSSIIHKIIRAFEAAFAFIEMKSTIHFNRGETCDIRYVALY